jgi:predicted Zn-dependent protease
MGDTTAAIKTLDEVNSLFDNIFFVRETAKLYYVFGEMDKSKTALEKHKTLFPERPPIINWLDAVHAYHEGNNPQPYINQLKNQYKNQASGSPAWFLAMTYAVMDEVQPTFDWLEKSYARHEVEMTWLKMEPLLDPYKKNPRYLDLLGRMNFPE